MKKRGEKMIFPARPRERRGELAVSQRAAKGADPAHAPKHHQDEAGLNADDLESEAGENAGADHVRHDDGRRRDQRNGRLRAP